jgi:hypothetical protein
MLARSLVPVRECEGRLNEEGGAHDVQGPPVRVVDKGSGSAWDGADGAGSLCDGPRDFRIHAAPSCRPGGAPTLDCPATDRFPKERSYGYGRVATVF